MRRQLASSWLILVLPVLFCGPLSPAFAQQKEESLEKLIEKLASKDNTTLLEAIEGLAEFGPKAADAVPGLVNALAVENEDVRLNAAITLGKIGKPAVSALEKSVTDDNAIVRFYALSALGWIGPDAKAAAPKVIAALADKNADVRRKAAYTLGKIAPNPKQAIKVLVQAFEDANPDVQKTAADAVANFGEEAVPALMTALDGTSASVKEHAIEALGKIGPGAKEAVPALAEFLNSPKSPLQNKAAASLGKVGEPAVETLKKTLAHPDKATRMLALKTLKDVGAPAVAEIIEALDSKHVEIRREAAQMLGQMNIQDKTIVIGLGFALKDKDDLVRQYAASSMTAMGKTATLAAKYLTAALLDPNPIVGQTCLNILKSIDENPMPGLVPGLESKDIKIRISTASLMAHTNYEVGKAIPILLDGLKQEDKKLQMQAAIAMTMTKQHIDKVVPVLMDAMKSDSTAVRQQAVAALAGIGGNAEPVISALVKALDDPEVEVRKQAFYALRFRQGIGEKVAAGFLKLMDEPDASFRQQVVNSLYQLGKAAQPIYLKALKDKDATVRQYAMWNVNASQMDAKVALPVLAELLQDKDAGVRQTAAQVLQNFGIAAVPTLIKALQHEDAGIRQQALQGLQNVNGNFKEFLPQLVPLLKDKNLQVRQTAYNILWRAGSDAIPYLVEGLSAKEGIIRQYSIHSLNQLKVTDSNIVKTIAELAREDPEGNVRSAAFQVLAGQGTKSVPQLKELLNAEKDTNVLAAEISALGTNGGLAKEFVPFLKEALKNSSPNVRWSAAHALGQAGPAGKEAIKPLTLALSDENYTVRHNALFSLKNMLPESGPSLALALKSKDINIRNQALDIFFQSKVQVKEAIPELIEILKVTGNPYYQWRAAQALSHYGPEAKEAIPALKKAINDPNPTVRYYAQQALMKIEVK